MAHLDAATPFVRSAHYYQFPIERNQAEMGRIGYTYAFHYVVGGKGTVTVGQHKYPVKKGDFIYFPPEVSHSFYAHPENPLITYNLYGELWGNKRVNTPHLVWNPSDFNRDLLTNIEPCSELDSLGVVTPIQHVTAIGELFIHAVTQSRKGGQYSDAIVGHLIKAFLLELIQVAAESQHIDYRIIPIIERMDKEANASRGYEAWMSACGLRKTQFHELFKQATGMSPKAYWTKAIMKHVEIALWESNRSITAIAEDFGYSSIHHFTKQFTQFHGVSPSEFRRSKH